MNTKKMLSAGVCPWCQSEVNTGAMACKSCGASEINGWQSLGAWRYIVWALSLLFLVGPGMMTMIFWPLGGLILVAVGIGGPIALQIGVRRNHNWIAPGSRARI
jgi:hypothetical protein